MSLVARLPPPLARLLLRVAFRTIRLWWRVRRPAHTGALVAVHHAGRVLMLRQSYQPLWVFPGGGVGSGEEPAAAAARELREEVGLERRPGDLAAALTSTRILHGRRDTVHFFALSCEEAPTIRIDEREIVEARWCTPDEALALRLVPHVRNYLGSAPEHPHDEPELVDEERRPGAHQHEGQHADVAQQRRDAEGAGGRHDGT